MTLPFWAGLLAAAALAAEPDPKALASYAFDARRPVPDRVTAMPDWLLRRWREVDDQPRYEPYQPTPAQRRLLEETLARLPERLREVLDRRLIAIYFISNLRGNGITDWVLDASKKTYFYMALNASAFDKTAAQLLSERERSPFDAPVDWSVETGDLPGIVYSIAHEGAHAYDYVDGGSPCTEGGHCAAIGRKFSGPWEVWTSYAEVEPAADHPPRKNLRFFGFGDPVPAATAPGLCEWLEGSPFVSLYAARSWAEDFAEVFFADHATRTLGAPYRIRCGGRAFEPMSDPRRRERAKRLLGPLL